jgi:hypothetical protein
MKRVSLSIFKRCLAISEPLFLSQTHTKTHTGTVVYPHKNIYKHRKTGTFTSTWSTKKIGKCRSM